MTFEDTSFMISSVDFSSGLMRDDFHHHQDYEMIYIIDGQIEMEIEGKLYQAGRDSLTPANYKNSTLHSGASHYSSARKTAADIG